MRALSAVCCAVRYFSARSVDLRKGVRLPRSGGFFFFEEDWLAWWPFVGDEWFGGWRGRYCVIGIGCVFDAGENFCFD